MTKLMTMKTPDGDQLCVYVHGMWFTVDGVIELSPDDKREIRDMVLRASGSNPKDGTLKGNQ